MYPYVHTYLLHCTYSRVKNSGFVTNLQLTKFDDLMLYFRVIFIMTSLIKDRLLGWLGVSHEVVGLALLHRG